MAEKIEFELVAPERLLISESVEMVVVPGSEGDFGVLAGHAPTVSSVRAGMIAVYDGGAVRERIFVAGGFAEVTPERCTVLADDAMPVEEIDRAEIERMLPDLRDDIAAARDDAERDAAARALATAEAKLAVLSSPTY
ncbi:MAG: F0F1 ATP synthase subunit epsilon [Rhodospirillales bacterium]|nr:MAG: F0F1 ATP synthase subunit epsilon [Rhodospirillales bacterium]